MNADRNVPAALWTEGLGEAEAKQVVLEAERGEDHDEISLHTFIDGRGSMCSFYLSRENAIRLASDILRAVELDRS